MQRRSTVGVVLALGALAGAARAEPTEAQVLTSWRRLLDVPLAKTTAHDLAWVVEPTGVAPTGSGSFTATAAPIDRSRLSYLGYRKPRSCGPFDAVHTLPRALNLPHHVYRYREHYILTASDGRREQLTVYAVARALELLRARLPREYQALFVGPRTPAQQLARIRARDRTKPVTFVNLTRAFAFVIDSGYGAIAKSSTTLGRRRVIDLGRGARQVGVFSNVARVHLNLTAMQGYGSRNLYGEGDPLLRFVRYLRDGLVETLVHEALHCLLRRDKNVRPLFWAIVRSVRGLGGEAFGKSAEETLVANVSAKLFQGRVGLSRAVSDYYLRLVRGQHRRRVGLVAGKETDAGVALRAVLRRHARSTRATFEELFWFDVCE